jgi:uncharacterized heparinase superfamily protein
MGVIQKLKRAVRGEVDPKTVLLEAHRRTQVAQHARRERNNLERLNTEMPQLRQPDLNSDALLAHFQTRSEPRFFSGFSELSQHFPQQNEQLLQSARQIVKTHSWPLLGFGVREFGQEIEWRRDPLSGYLWPLDYHRDIQLIRNDGSDARVLWEINRLGHLVTVALSFSISGDGVFSLECLTQLESWTKQNPYGRGINWTCAMEVALRSINLLAVFEMVKQAPEFDRDTLQLFVKLFHQHGTYIRQNLEFSHISTSNHYLSDLAGLLWLGILLPEFSQANEWRDFALAAMLREMDKQVLADGADFESSTSYHRFVLELFLYSFILCKENDIQIPKKYWEKLHSMLRFVRGYLRPDGHAPLIGDSDSGRVLPMFPRPQDDHAYLLDIGAVLFNDRQLRIPNANGCPELFCLLRSEGLESLNRISPINNDESQSFPNAGIYVMRSNDLYLLMNTTDAGLDGRGSHGHNDALSIEVSAGGRDFIVDPGTYVYTADLQQRHLFRSTAYHSTVMIDREEQNTTLQSVPFVIGNEARPKVIEWTTSVELDRIIAEHSGYLRLASGVTHRRTVWFYKEKRYWLIEDEFFGDGEHEYEVRFHFAPGLDVRIHGNSAVALESTRNASFSIISLDLKNEPVIETQATSIDYGEKKESISVCWHVAGRLSKLRWELRPDHFQDLNG